MNYAHVVAQIQMKYSRLLREIDSGGRPPKKTQPYIAG